MALLKSITKSKIVCTLGPTTNTSEHILKLAEIGMDCTRINFSHGSAQDKIDLFKLVRETDDHLAILCDIQGPKIRIGMVKEGGVLLRSGDSIIVTTDDVTGDEQKITITYPGLELEIKVGELIYINDGIVCLKVTSITGKDIHCDILAGGNISSRKGVNLPSSELSQKVPTEKDVIDLKLIAELDPEYVAISFVSEASDVNMIRKILTDNGNDRIKLISKIERPFALENFDAILKASDGIMVARGDLGVEIPPQEVVPAQKEIVRKCNVEGKPVIVATQMLESMINAPVPTRAEVSDVFNAIMDGADAVMLSAETASGKYPENAVTIMENIIKRSEAMMKYRDPDEFDSEHETTTEIIGHLVYSACKEFKDITYKKGKVLCVTQSGHSARMISKYRPMLPIIGASSNIRTVREMRLLWGLEPMLIPEIRNATSTTEKIKLVVQACCKESFLDDDEKIIVTGNFLDLDTHHNNMISIFPVNELLNS
ncbi:MAG: pyruvate kinase [Deltaproteobacteria bacterium]|jgi:pyruvate kinase|nr:pyruvate kinase [Deltaproteobacteria bacterium]MBT4527392.1 pyruvate kinase [Deltaproteobacteria bacterium]